MSFQTSALILSWLAIGLLALVVSGLVRQVHALSSGAIRRPDRAGPRPGEPAPGYSLLAPAEPATLVLFFLDEGCRTCREILTAARQIDAPQVALRALYRDDIPAYAADSPLPVLGGQAPLFTRYDVAVTPFAVLIDPDGRVLRAEPVGSRAALDQLIEQIVPPGNTGSDRRTIGVDGGRR